MKQKGKKTRKKKGTDFQWPKWRYRVCEIGGTREVEMGDSRQKLEEIVAENFTNLLDAINPQFQETQLATNWVNTPKTLYQCMSNCWNSDEEKKCTYSGKYDLLCTEELAIHKKYVFKPEWWWNDIFKVLKEKKIVKYWTTVFNGILCPEKLSLR